MQRQIFHRAYTVHCQDPWRCANTMFTWLHVFVKCISMDRYSSAFPLWIHLPYPPAQVGWLWNDCGHLRDLNEESGVGDLFKFSGLCMRLSVTSMWSYFSCQNGFRNTLKTSGLTHPELSPEGEGPESTAQHGLSEGIWWGEDEKPDGKSGAWS